MDKWITPDEWVSVTGGDLPGETATFGAGCYWGTEKYIANDFARRHPKAILGTAVGFMGPVGAKTDPSYREVCTGSTGHVEVLHLKFDPAVVPYESLVRFFYEFHDPTTLNRQGNDSGSQYASAIFTHSDAQAETARKVTEELSTLVRSGKIKGYVGNQVTTAILPATKFYPGPIDHQRYLEVNPGGYCNHKIRFQWSAM